jgi:glycine cleavage system H protein
MSAGVLSYWLCPWDFQCEACALDLVLSGRGRLRSGGAATDPTANAAATDGDVLHRPSDGALRHLQVPLRRRRGLHYHPDHVWARPAGPGRLRLGLDDLAARLTEGAEEWALPLPGQRLTTGDTLGRVYARGRLLRVASPLAGRVVARNDALPRWPTLAVWSPYDDGWLVEIETDVAPSTASGFLVDESVVASWFDAEVERLATGCPDPAEHPQLGPTLADGGQPAMALRDILGEAGLRAALRRMFPLSA